MDIVGAIYLDRGFDVVYDYLKQILMNDILNASIDNLTDYKSKLQELMQSEQRDAVNYVTIDEKGPAHDKTFTVNVLYNGIVLGTGSGKSKKEAEDLLIKYGKDNDVKTYVYRFPNVFGKWCRPNYNSAVATFCNNIANDLPIQVNDRNTQLELVYIDDIVDEMFNCLEGKEHRDGDLCFVETTHKATLGEIVDLIYKFNDDSSEDNCTNYKTISNN